MNRELKRISLVVGVMFLSLFVASTNLQVLSADSLAADPRNVRAIYDGYQTKRGAILVDGQPIVLQLLPGSNRLGIFCKRLPER